VRVQSVFLFQMAAVHGLVGTLNLDSDGGLALLADLDGLVITLNGCPVVGMLDIDQ
jgi:hypothetical protein